MENFSPVRPWLVFDLKGATANRRALDSRQLHSDERHSDERHCETGGHGAGDSSTSWGTLRDWEWLDIAMVIDLSRKDRAALAETIAADAVRSLARRLLPSPWLHGACLRVLAALDPRQSL